MPDKDYNLFSDELLLKLLVEDDKKAYNEIYNRYWEQLFLYVAKAITDREGAKDIVQEIFISLWVRRLNLAAISSLKAYLFSAGRYKGLSYIRENISKKKYLQSMALYIDLATHSVHDKYTAKELSNLIDKEIEKLPSKMKEVFILSRKEDHSYKWIAENLMISDKTVKKQVSNVLKKFKLRFAAK